jgi:hypothetical protein
MRIRTAVVLFIFSVAAAAQAKTVVPPAPTLLAPAAGAGVQIPFTISWSAVTDPSGIVAYNWQVSTSSAFTNIVVQNSTSGQTQDTVGGLANGTYFWRVQAVSGAQVQGAWSATRSFTVTGTASDVPALNPPKGYSTFHPMEVMTFNWTAVPGAASYVFQFSRDPSFPVLGRGQFDNIPNTTMSFAIGDADEGNYWARVYAVDGSGTAGAPSNSVPFSVFFNNPLPPPPSPVSPVAGTLTLPLMFTWTDVPNPQPSGYELQIAKDSGFQTIEEDVPQLNSASRRVLSLTSGTKFWRVRSSQGDSSPGTAAVTAWSKTGSFTVSSATPAPVSLAFTSNPVFSGNSTWVALQLSGAAPAAGATINLSSSNPSAFPVPASITMPGNIAWTQFQMSAGQVTAPTPVTVTATVNSFSTSASITVLPPSLKALTISPSSISGGATTGAIIMLNGVAPLGGAVVSLASNSPAVNLPAAVTVQAGSPSVSFGISTNPVTVNTPVTVTASWNGGSVPSQVTLLPLQPPASLTLSPTSTVGTGGSSFGTVRVASAATFDQTFQLTSSNPAIARVNNSMVVPAGVTAGGFNIFTSTVSVSTPVTITVSGGGGSQSAVLTVLPDSAPSSTSNLSVTATGRSGERVTSSPAGINVQVGTTVTAPFPNGTVITLTVSNGRSAIWSGACSSGGNKTASCRFTLNGNASVTANVQ